MKKQALSSLLILVYFLINCSADTPLQTKTFTIGTGFNNNVQDLAIQSNGKIIVGGLFTEYNSNPSNFIACLNTGGTIDPTFLVGEGFDRNIRTLFIQTDDKILVGGQFNTYQGIPARGIIRLNPNGLIDNTFVYGSALNDFTSVEAFAEQNDSKLIIGGGFTNYNDTGINRIARLNQNGSIDNSFNVGSGFNGTVMDIQLQSDGKIICVGAFTKYNNETVNGIIRLNTDGTIDKTFVTGSGFSTTPNNPFTINIESDGQIIIGGKFTNYNGTEINRIIRLNTDGSLDNSFNVGSGFNDIVFFRNAIQNDDRLIVCGAYTGYNGSPVNRIVRLKTDGSIDNTFNNGSGFDSTTLSVVTQSDGKIIIGGAFLNYNTDPVSKIIRLNADGSSDTIDL
ncbi:delta-60 repeat domain-containing protein [Seonamhaeicola sp.]|uniref:delta-60 repeat domain-containing protein n=1 Tax=Seonamhaeicola sp. TaxID=1912245 RepID=UPI0026203CB6|nr:delta-60 repeat domain-containing protein [Seonamhaeicola sp.]